MFVNRGHKDLKQSLSAQASSTAQRSKHSLPLKTLIVEDERRSIAFHTSLVFPSVTTADECSCHTALSVFIRCGGVERASVGCLEEAGRVTAIPAWLWNLSVGERRPHGAPAPLEPMQTMDQDPAKVERPCWYLNTGEVYCFTLSLLALVCRPQHYFTSTAGHLSKWMVAEPMSVFLYELNP